jgi:hypothetical protein
LATLLPITPRSAVAALIPDTAVSNAITLTPNKDYKEKLKLL